MNVEKLHKALDICESLITTDGILCYQLQEGKDKDRVCWQLGDCLQWGGLLLFALCKLPKGFKIMKMVNRLINGFRTLTYGGSLNRNIYYGSANPNNSEPEENRWKIAGLYEMRPVTLEDVWLRRDVSKSGLACAFIGMKAAHDAGFDKTKALLTVWGRTLVENKWDIKDWEGEKTEHWDFHLAGSDPAVMLLIASINRKILGRSGLSLWRWFSNWNGVTNPSFITLKDYNIFFHAMWMLNQKNPVVWHRKFNACVKYGKAKGTFWNIYFRIMSNEGSLGAAEVFLDEIPLSIDSAMLWKEPRGYNNTTDKARIAPVWYIMLWMAYEWIKEKRSG